MRTVMVAVNETRWNTFGVNKQILVQMFNQFPEFFVQTPRLYLAIASFEGGLDFLVEWLNSQTPSGQPRELVLEDCLHSNANVDNSKAFLTLIKQVNGFF